MLAAFQWRVVLLTKNQSVRQMGQHTIMSVCFNRKCVFCDSTSLYNTLAAVKVRNIANCIVPISGFEGDYVDDGDDDR